MLASSFVEWRSIELTAPAQAAAVAEQDDLLVIRLRTDGLRLNGETITLDVLAARVRAHLTTVPQGGVRVQVAPGVPLQDAIAVVDQLAAAGAVELSLVRDEAQ